MKRLNCSLVGVVMLVIAALAAVKTPDASGVFGKYPYLAQCIVSDMTLDERIAQTIMAEYQSEASVAEMQRYQFGGYIFFARSFNDKDRAAVQAMLAKLQSVARIPLLTAVDEEGGIVTRVSQNSQLASARFAPPQSLYQEGGLERIREDTLAKSELLRTLGLNLNLAPVVDVSTNPDDYMYTRALGEDAARTAEYAQTVIQASQGTGVSYTLKHFPGYGNNIDTHTGASVDSRTYDGIIQNDLLPFRAGIAAGAEAVLVSHNIVTSIDANTPASLSAPIHQLLRQELGFSGVILTDEITMGALSGYSDAAVRALQAGNDMLITKDAVKNFWEIRAAVESGKLDEAIINRAATRIIAWKLYKGLI